MTNSIDTANYLSQRLKTSGWHIVSTIGLGLAAVVLAFFGQQFLADARPLFPVIEQNYAIWQTAYAAVVLLIGVLWVVAMSQRVKLFRDCQQRIAKQRLLDDEREERAQHALMVKMERERLRAEAEPVPFFKRNPRGSKFDY